MYKKRVLMLVMTLILILSLMFPLSATGVYETSYPESFNKNLEMLELESSVYESGSTNMYALDGIEEQFERLYELMNILQSSRYALVVPFTDSGEPLYIPNINLIAPPHGEGGNFVIGLEIDYGSLVFGDWEAMKELSLQAPPTEVVEFILSFAGIPYDMAEVGFSIVFDIPLLPADYIITGVCPVWGDERNVLSDEHSIYATYTRNIPARMGQLAHIAGIGTGTLGHPSSTSNSSRAFSSIHRNLHFPGNSVSIGRSGTPGQLRGSIQNPTIDVAAIDVMGSVSPELPSGWHWPGGNRIVFRNTPPLDARVASLRGISGVRHSHLFRTNAIVGELRDKIITLEELGTEGDSGAALIRIHDSAVLGTLRSGIFFQGQRMSVYSCVQNYIHRQW